MKKAKELKRIQDEAEEATRKAIAEQKRLQQMSANAGAVAREKENLHNKPATESKKEVVYLNLNEMLLQSGYLIGVLISTA